MKSSSKDRFFIFYQASVTLMFEVEINGLLRMNPNNFDGQSFIYHSQAKNLKCQTDIYINSLFTVLRDSKILCMMESALLL